MEKSAFSSLFFGALVFIGAIVVLVVFPGMKLSLPTDTTGMSSLTALAQRAVPYAGVATCAYIIYRIAKRI